VFFDALIEINGIKDFQEWFFYPGMLFGSSLKWWGKPGERPAIHEGIDLCFYKDQKGKMRSLNSSSLIPAMDAGRVTVVSDDDYLGKSVFVRHASLVQTAGTQKRVLHSVYAHVCPASGISPGRILDKNEVIGTISSLKGRNLKISEHVHFSLIWMPEHYPAGSLLWDKMMKDNALVFTDPFTFLSDDNPLPYVTGIYTNA
jgi:murein DD-endopeptidase MepM/ murein hydrolase activator NlpD